MITSPRSRPLWVLVWSTAAGFAGTPAEMAAQSWPGQQRGRLGAWMMEARASSFHASIQADGIAIPVANHPGQAGGWAPHRVSAGMPAGPDSTVSPGKIFVSTLIGAAIPVASVMLYWHFGLEELPIYNDWEGLGLMVVSSASLLTVPLAAGLVGVDSLGRTLVGTGLGFLLGVTTIAALDGGSSLFYVAPPAFALTMATVTTLAITIRQGK